MVEAVVGAQLRHSKSQKRPMVMVYSAMLKSESEEKNAFTVLTEYSQTRNRDCLMFTAILKSLCVSALARFAMNLSVLRSQCRSRGEVWAEEELVKEELEEEAEEEKE